MLKALSVRALNFSPKEDRNSSIFNSTSSVLKERWREKRRDGERVREKRRDGEREPTVITIRGITGHKR